jgi:alpha-N-arabinofuranosidase
VLAPGGVFLSIDGMNFNPRSAILCAGALYLGVLISCAGAAQPVTHRLVIQADQPGAQISRNIYGQFSEHLGRCIYEGIWVGENSPIPNTRGIRNDVVEALKKIQVPVLRWPGGCFADEYHWKDGIGPRTNRPAMINTHWGGVTENNHFGTHEFMDFCAQIGAAPCICGNVGSGTVQEMMEWIEYITSDADSPMANLRRANGRAESWKLPYFAVGNESWGCGGNMTPEFYSDQYRRYNTFIKNYDRRNPIQRIACGASDADYNWTQVLMSNAGRHMNGLSLHYYTLPTGSWRGSKGPAIGFKEEQWFSTLRRTLRMEELVTRHSQIMDKTDPQKRIGLMVDEWGTWYDVAPGSNPGFLYQQNTLRDALVAGINLNIFNNHADRVKMANIAQMINVLQAMILTDKEKMIVTPTYHVFEMYTVHHDATLLPCSVQGEGYRFGTNDIPTLHASASRDKTGKIHVTLCNLNPNQPAEIEGEVQGAKSDHLSGRVLTAPEMDAHNSFDNPAAVQPVEFLDFKGALGKFTAVLPAKSVTVLELE